MKWCCMCIIGLSAVIGSGERLTADIVSTFDGDSEGWTIKDISWPVGNPPTVIGSDAGHWASTGGNPNGTFWTNDLSGGQTYFSAPAKFLGNHASAFGTTLGYDLRLASGTAQSGDNFEVILVGADTTLLGNFNDNLPDSAWQSFGVELAGGSFRLNALGGPVASDADVQAVLEDLSGLYIFADFVNGRETTYLDNVSMVPEPSTVILLATGALGLLAYGCRRRQGH